MDLTTFYEFMLAIVIAGGVFGSIYFVAAKNGKPKDK